MPIKGEQQGYTYKALTNGEWQEVTIQESPIELMERFEQDEEWTRVRHGHWIFNPKDAIEMMFTLQNALSAEQNHLMVETIALTVEQRWIWMRWEKMKLFKRNPCEECDYYIKENNTCQSKKVSTYGSGYVSFIDRMFCEPYKAKAKQEKKDDEVRE